MKRIFRRLQRRLAELKQNGEIAQSDLSVEDERDAPVIERLECPLAGHVQQVMNELNAAHLLQSFPSGLFDRSTCRLDGAGGGLR